MKKLWVLSLFFFEVMSCDQIWHNHNDFFTQYLMNLQNKFDIIIKFP